MKEKEELAGDVMTANDLACLNSFCEKDGFHKDFDLDEVLKIVGNEIQRKEKILEDVKARYNKYVNK